VIRFPPEQFTIINTGIAPDSSIFLLAIDVIDVIMATWENTSLSGGRVFPFLLHLIIERPPKMIYNEY
jgi:hypothetical protein